MGRSALRAGVEAWIRAGRSRRRNAARVRIIMIEETRGRVLRRETGQADQDRVPSGVDSWIWGRGTAGVRRNVSGRTLLTRVCGLSRADLPTNVNVSSPRAY